MTARRLLLPAGALLVFAAALTFAFLPAGRRESPRTQAGSAGSARASEAPENAASAPESSPSEAAVPADAPGIREELRGAATEGRVKGRIEVVGKGEPPSGARVYLVTKDPLPDAGALASGMISEALEDPTVWSRPGDLPKPVRGSSRDPHAQARSDGSFEVEVPRKAAEYWALVEAEFHYQERAPRVRVEESGAAPEFIVPVHPGGRVLGSVRAHDGRPVRGAKIRLVPPFDPFSMFAGRGADLIPRETESDEAGNWFLGGVRPGNAFLLAARAEGEGPAVRTGIDVLEGKEVRLDLALPAEGAIAGTVVDEAGRPIAGAKVDAKAGGDPSTLLAMGDHKVDASEDGSFRLGGLAAGEFGVSAEKDGWKRSKRIKVRVEEGATAKGISLVLPEGNSISGRVLDPKGATAKGVAVYAGFEMKAFSMPDPETLAGGTKGYATTKEDGSFRIGGLGKGPFRIRAKAPDESSADASGVKPGTKDLELRLRAPGGLAGIVVDAKTGLPVPAFSLRTLQTALGMLEVKGREKEFHSEEGAFKWTGLPPGTYTISARAAREGHAPARLENLVVKEGVTTPGLVIELQPEAAVRGRVLAAGTGVPVQGALVTTGKPGMFGMLQSMSGDRPEARTDEEGAFRIDALPPGEVTLAATHPDFANGQSESFRLEQGAELRDVEIVLSAGGGVDGFVLGEDGRPISGAWVMANSPAATVFRSAKTDEQGYFRMKALAPGAYQVTSLPMRFDAAADADAMQRMMDGMKATSAEVEEGRVTRVVFGEGEEGGVRVHGRVLSGDRPVSGAILTANPAGMKAGLRMRNSVSREDGSYSIDGVRPGANLFAVQRMDASSGSFTMIEIPVDVPEGPEFTQDLRLPVASIAGRVTDARSGEPLEGIRVSLQREDREEGGMFGGGFFEAQTAADGAYRFEGVKEGRYTVAAGGATFLGSNPKGFGRVIRSALSVADGTVLKGIDFALLPGGTIVGTVRDASGRPVEGASIFFREEGGAVVNRLSEIFTDGGGGFRAPGLSAGTFRVVARASGAGIGTVDGVVVRPGEDTRTSIAVSPGTDLTARVLDPDGKPVAGARASLFDDSGEAVSGFTGVADFVDLFRKGAPGPGEIRVGTYAPGSYQLRVTAAGFRPRDVAVSLGGEAEKAVEVRLERE
ncbi:MAG TPA: carboxypeptidase regulatory-like domain-containing protein [Planctomycetota bacterium]|jgi:protocatechuate 3,4-dioxygenase beta subunit|nr:carboxypeptidase regulatory-like domain-containing protein [Planctomycetota bacterium]